VLDTHLGSQSSRIAAYHAGLDFYGCEIDPGYFKSGCARFDRECRGIEVINGHEVQQLNLFDL
jgi:site-specific DNA-methyltransferase (adenine-specific)